MTKTGTTSRWASCSAKIALNVCTATWLVVIEVIAWHLLFFFLLAERVVSMPFTIALLLVPSCSTYRIQTVHTYVLCGIGSSVL